MSNPWRHFQQRSLLYQTIRRYFDDSGFLEVETPLFSPSPIPESHIELFETLRIRTGESPQSLFLLPSPEFWMKRILAQGAPSIYQISRCFRNGEQIDRWHRYEFTMLEWYEIGINAHENMQRMQELFFRVRQAFCIPDSVSEAFVFITMEQAFQEFAGFSLEEDILRSGWNTCEPKEKAGVELKRIFRERLQQRHLPAGDDEESADDLFHRLFIALVEDSLPSEGPLILGEWPVLIPSLARRIPGTPWAERWELYYKGVEVANCYTEENDEDALKAFWKSEAAKKGFPDSLRNDERWIKAVAGKLPHCSGAAAGLDRWLALIRGDDGLEGLDIFPIGDIIGE